MKLSLGHRLCFLQGILFLDVFLLKYLENMARTTFYAFPLITYQFFSMVFIGMLFGLIANCKLGTGDRKLVVFFIAVNFICAIYIPRFLFGSSDGFLIVAGFLIVRLWTNVWKHKNQDEKQCKS